MNKWFANAYRRNLVDMHIEDWNDEFLSLLNPEEYVENLKTAKIQATMVYLQSHVGHCYFPTRVGHTHRAMTGENNKIKQIIDLCHKNGIFVTGYYSLIYNTDAEDGHPEWRIIDRPDENGNPVSDHDRGSRYGLCCPNNEEYRRFVKTQISEMADYFSLDGIFYDMTFWPNEEFCKCDSCKAKYKAETGKDTFPPLDWKNREWLQFNHIREKQIGEFAKFVTDTTKEIMGDIVINHNYANSIAGSAVNASTEIVADSCTYVGGDLYGDNYNHSFTAKYYYGLTKNQPFEYMTCRCDSTLYVHTITKTEAFLKSQIMVTAAHHGATLIIDAIDPVGTLDRRVYERLRKAFDMQIPYEKYFYGEMQGDVAIYFASTGKYNSNGEDYNSIKNSVNLSKTLIEANVPFTVENNNTTEKLGKYKFVFAPAVAGISERNRADLVNYVKSGGILYFSGIEEPRLTEEFFNAAPDGYCQNPIVYLAPTEE